MSGCLFAFNLNFFQFDVVLSTQAPPGQMLFSKTRHTSPPQKVPPRPPSRESSSAGHQATATPPPVSMRPSIGAQQNGGKVYVLYH